jgi:flagellar basal body P-ring formation protein FlgA
VLAVACGTASSAEPAPLPEQGWQQVLALAQQAATPLAPAGARVVALPGAADPRLRLAPCDRLQAFLPAQGRPWGRSRVGLRCVQGAVAWQVYLPVTVQAWAPAPVARAPLSAGSTLAADTLDTAVVDWAAGPTPPLADAGALAGRLLARTVAAGQPLRAADLRPRQWFASGATVQVTALGDGFQVQAEGVALGPGVEGQPTRVRTEAGRTLVGLPVGPTRVEMRL